MVPSSSEHLVKFAVPHACPLGQPRHSQLKHTVHLTLHARPAAAAAVPAINRATNTSMAPAGRAYIEIEQATVPNCRPTDRPASLQQTNG
jgi:hypothetical protein